MAYYDRERGWNIAGQFDDEFEAAQNPTSYEQLVNAGIIKPSEYKQNSINMEEGNKKPSSFVDKALEAGKQIDKLTGEYVRPDDKEYKEGMTPFEVAGDIVKSVATEASHIFQRKEDEYNYDSESRLGEAAKYLYRYGIGMLPFIGAGKLISAVSMTGKIAKNVKLAKTLKNTGKLLTGEYEALNKINNPVLKRAAKGSIEGLTAGELASFTYSRPEEHEDTLFFKANDEDNEFMYKLKHTVGDIIPSIVGGAVLNTTLTPLIEKLGKSLLKIKNTKKEDIAKDLLEKNAAYSELNKNLKGAALISEVDKAYNQALKDGVDPERYIKEQFEGVDPILLDDIYSRMKNGHKVIINEDGSISIQIEKWQDFSELTVDEIKNQTGNNAVKYMDEAVKDDWKYHKLLEEGEELVTPNINKKGEITSYNINTKAEKQIKDYYQNKFNLKKPVKIVWEEGKIQGSDGYTPKLEKTPKEKLQIENKKLRLETLNKRLKRLQDIQKTVGEENKPKTFYNQTSANQSKKDILNKLKEVRGEEIKDDYIVLRRKNKFFKKKIGFSNTQYIIDTERNLYNIIDEIIKNPKIIENDLKIEEFEKKISQYLNDEDGEFSDYLYKKFYDVLDLANQYNEINQNYKLSKSVKIKDDIEKLQKDIKLKEKDLDLAQSQNLVIHINKQSEHPYAVLRSELEHIRDINNHSTPKQAEIVGSGEHFSRYKGDNEAEASIDFVKGKADRRVNKEVNNTSKQDIDFTDDDLDFIENKQYTFSDEVMNVKGKDYDVIRVKNKEGKTISHIRYSLWGNNNVYIDMIQNYGVEKGAGRIALKQLMEKFPDRIFYWEAINEGSVKSYNKFVSEYPELAERINFQSRVEIPKVDDADDFFNTFESYNETQYNNSDKGVINEGTNNNTTERVQPGISREGMEINRGEGKGNKQTIDNKQSQVVGESTQVGEDFTGNTTINERGETTFNNNRQLPIHEQFGNSGLTVGDITERALNSEIAHFGSQPDVIRAMNADELSDFFSQLDFEDDTGIKVALNQGDLDHLRYTANACIALTKVRAELQNKLMEAVTTEEKRKLIQGIGNITQTLNSFGSETASALQSRRFMKKCINIFELTENEKLGMTSFMDVLKSEIRSLNFTEGEPKEIAESIINRLAKKQPDIMENFVNKPELYDEFLDGLYRIVRKGKQPTEGEIEGLVQDVITNRLVEAMILKAKAATPEGIGNIFKDVNTYTTYYINNLLSNPRTQVVNLAGGILNTLYQPIEKLVGSIIPSSYSKEMRKEAVLQFLCLGSNIGEALEAFKQAFKSGEGQLVNIGKETAIGEGKKQFEGMGSFIAKDKEGSIEWLKTLGNVYQSSLRLMGATDEAITQLNYRSLVQAKAIVQAEKEAIEQGLEGSIKEDFIKQRGSEAIIQAFNVKGKPLDVEAYSQARDILLQTPTSGKIWNYESNTYKQVKPKTKLMQAADILQSKPFLRFICPFVRTPINMMQQTLERDILYNVLSSGQRELLLSNTREGVMARGRLGAGLLMYMGCYMLATTGRITGQEPNEPKVRQALLATGWKPYSIKIGDKYYSYKGIYPVETFLGLGANAVHLFNDFKYDEEGVEHLSKYGIEGIRMIADLCLEQGPFSQTIESLSLLNDLLQGRTDISKSGANYLKGYLPLSNLGNFIGNLRDNSQTKPESFYEKLFNKYFNSGLGDYRRNIFGEVETMHTTLLLTKSYDLSDNPEDEEMERLAEEGSFTPELLHNGEAGYTFKYSDFKSDKYDKSLYNYFLETMSTTEINGMTLREAVRDLVTSEEYQDLEYDGTLEEARENNKEAYKRTDKTKINAIKDVFDEYRAKAKKEVLEEYGDDFFNIEGVSANEIKNQQHQNKMNALLNQSIQNIRSFS